MPENQFQLPDACHPCCDLCRKDTKENIDFPGRRIVIVRVVERKSEDINPGQ